ncbi:MAG: hypothetical protein ACK559_24150 [bacterium]
MQGVDFLSRLPPDFPPGDLLRGFPPFLPLPRPLEPERLEPDGERALRVCS